MGTPLQVARKYWSEKLGLGWDEKKARKKRMKLREAKKAQRQAKYAKSRKVGNKAVENQRRKRRQADRIAKGMD